MTSKVIQVQKILNKNISEAIGKDKKFTMLLASEPFSLPKEEHRGFNERYEKIKEFFTITNSLVYKALFHKTKEAKELYTLIFSGKKQEIINEQRLWYKNEKNPLPLFFRTDESQPGIITEIQCPGSGIAQVGELQKAWEQVLGKKLWPDWDRQIVKDIIKVTKKKNPKLIYLPRSSCIEDAELFYQKTAELGLVYLNPLVKNNNDYKRLTKKMVLDANFIKAHSYGFQRVWPIFKEMVKSASKKEITIDVPPALIFNMKLNMALPFYKRTKQYYPNYIHLLFPETIVIEPNKKIRFENKKITYEEYSDLPDRKRKHILKSASGISIPDIEFGGRGVFSLSRTSRKKCLQLFKQALTNYKEGERWVIQPEMNKRYEYKTLKHRKIIQESGYAKFSGFYGPNGLIARRAFFKNYYKVGGSKETTCAVILPKK